MALAKDRISSVQSCAINGISSRVDNNLPPILLHENHKLGIELGERENGSPSIANTNEVLFQSECHKNHRDGLESFLHGNGSLLSFANQKDDEYSCWDNGNSSYHSNQKSGLFENVNCVYSEGFDIRQPQHSNIQKRTHQGETNEQATKKQCNNGSKKTKPKAAPSKDPQSIAAKNRRERISERLKILQELVPNGSKVDSVTMLEKAISYVKFLQLQVKVLATDEFWPVQGGKAPDISQVKEAIDAILSSHKDRNLFNCQIDKLSLGIFQCLD